ncbi:formate dehydrogenase accessory sulfurtransferase FdhD [Microbulbifer zhoushanensis]|uniref:formate dehydrogenase accessory sulfurtransferase FdhD n=1 Tax=Microbulbifer zhoushanensis TaxID=2904254 RepID=UPI001F0148A7|nr:formate dehydrogenase accessory sulfurtransferase FdhD [Microbulbifer zhoushanensis]
MPECQSVDAIPGSREAGTDTYCLPEGGDSGADRSQAHRQGLAQEAAIAISYNGLNHAVMMATPDNLADFAVGFSISSRVIDSPDQIIDISVDYQQHSACLEITLVQRALHGLKAMRRNLAGSGSCGLCGTEALQQALLRHPANSIGPNRPLPPQAHLRSVRERFQQVQKHRHHSGAMHAALYVSSHGQTLLCREDIGRHNALDKLLGACFRQGIALEQGFVAVTSRCGLELVQKAVRAGVGTLVSLSAPSDFSVRWARDCGLNLLHQTARGEGRIYSPAPESDEERL